MIKEMDKKNYLEPEMDVFEFDMKQNVLTGSPTGDVDEETGEAPIGTGEI